jgi:transposase
MPRTHRPYPPQYRRRMIELVRAGRNLEDLAREFEPCAQSIRSWVAQVDRNEGRREDGLASDERQARTRLPRENRLKQARESLGFSRHAGIVQETGSIPFKGSRS